MPSSRTVGREGKGAGAGGIGVTADFEVAGSRVSTGGKFSSITLSRTLPYRQQGGFHGYAAQKGSAEPEEIAFVRDEEGLSSSEDDRGSL
jgi:hypothetical protein